mmetsp:Transcript_20033/g.34431  ORF Transcript_20033/g.34431 Transcript_20033/m.34431 type:complete len:120 (+) Transcript_20033:227-586(+)
MPHHLPPYPFGNLSGKFRHHDFRPWQPYGNVVDGSHAPNLPWTASPSVLQPRMLVKGGSKPPNKTNQTIAMLPLPCVLATALALLLSPSGGSHWGQSSPFVARQDAHIPHASLSARLDP